MRWEGSDTDNVSYACEECGVLIPHNKKRWMVERGEWRATHPGNGRHVGFHIWAAYSYSPNAEWSNLAEEFELSKHDPEQLKTWINTTLGECWEDEYASKVGADALMERAAEAKYEVTVPPAEALVLCMGCDVQDDRLSMSVFGYGRNEEMFLVDRKVIYGSPARADLWKQMDEVLMGQYINQDGFEMKIESAAIDTGGHYTQETYQYVRERSKLGLIGIKGIGQKGKPPLGKPTTQDITFSGKALRRGVKLFPVGVDVIKTTLHNKLKNAEKGEGYIHFYPTITHDYFEELTAERQVLRYKHGYQERVWMKKSNARNEALDEMVYSWAAFERFRQRYDRRTMWDQLEKRRNPKEPKQEVPLRSKGTKSANRQNFVGNW